jgi:LysM repeat protein
VYGAGGYTNDYTLTLGRDEGYHVALTDATSSKLLPGTTTQTIDANGHLIGIHDATQTATQPGSYTVRAGETLQSIALAVYGDASLWYRIADANGMGSSNSLRAGQVLSLPAQIGGLHNNAGTVTPYDPGKVVGDTSPNLPQPQAHGGGGCGGLGQLIVVVVAVVATIYTAGLALEAVGGAGATFATVSTTEAIAIGAASAAAGSIAGQLTGMALGVQSDFSWKQVGMAAIGGAVSAGLTNVLGEVQGTSNLMLRAAENNAISQGVNIVVGNQHSFQWKGVAASAAGAWAGQETNDALLGKVQLDGAGEVMRDAAGHMVRGTSALTEGFARTFGGASGFAAASLSGIASGTVASVARAGRVSVQQVASDAFGNALGESIAGAMTTSTTKASAYSLASGDSSPGLSLSGLSGTGLRQGDYRASAVALDKTVLALDGANVGEHGADISESELNLRRAEVEKQVRLEILGQEERAASLSGADFVQTIGPARGAARSSNSRVGLEMVRNGNWDGALNLAADPWGFAGVIPELQADMATLSVRQAEDRIETLRQSLIGAGVKEVPSSYSESISVGSDGIARTSRDYTATLDDLQKVYENHVRDTRLRETWGNDYRDIRLGKSGMTVIEFEKKVLDIHMSSVDKAYTAGVDAIAKGELEVKPGDYARALGSFIDDQVRIELRGFARAEGISENRFSNLWAINRRIQSEFVLGWGVPDNRLGLNLYADTTLAWKSAETPQLTKWNNIRPGSFVMLRPSSLGGPYVIPRQLFPQQTRLPGKGI